MNVPTRTTASAVRGALVMAAIGLATVWLTGCSAPAPAPALSSARADGASSRQQLTRALSSCGLTLGDPGVAITSANRLALLSHADGQPTSVGTVTASCVLKRLQMPASDATTFDSDSVYGGYDVAAWSHFTASWSFRDTLTFELHVYPA